MLRYDIIKISRWPDRQRGKQKKSLSALLFLGSAPVPLPFKPLGTFPTIYIADGRSYAVALFRNFSLQSYYAYLVAVGPRHYVLLEFP